MDKSNTIRYFNDLADRRLHWKKKNRYYHSYLEKYYSFIIPAKSRVLEIGSGTGELLNAVKPSYGVGIDFSEKMVEIASEQFPELTFLVQDAEELKIEEKFDYIILSDLISTVWDVQKVFSNLTKASTSKTKIILNFHNYLWEPILKSGEIFGIKAKNIISNWLTYEDVRNLCELEGFEVIRKVRKILIPKRIPIANGIFNSFLSNLPIINSLSLICFITIQKKIETNEERSVSIVIPARNEKGNIEQAILRTPIFGSRQEFIFVEGHSSDGTYDEILRVKAKYPDKGIVAFKQQGKGKGNAVREGFDCASGEILMIMDADLTTPPEDMPKFYEALIKNRGEFINGCRLVYPMESEAMRPLNMIANRFFGRFFSYILGQRLKDTLCGTKVLYKSDYEKIEKNRSYFGDFDPFGDFDLLFGAAKLNLKIVEVIVRYRDRQYGSTQISRFKHGWLLLRMSLFAARKLKFI